jgi:hypothetical protein
LFRDIALTIRPDGRHGALDITRTSATAVAGHLTGFARTGTRLLTRRQFWGHDVIIHRFIDATLGRGSSPVPVQDALNVVELTDNVITALHLHASRRT